MSNISSLEKGGLSSEGRLALLRKMVQIRRFEESCAQAFMHAKIKGFCHLYIGEEAVAVGTISALGEGDSVITAYRDHGHALARGLSAKECMAELFGKRTGCSKGKGGSMHLFSKEKNFFGGHGIVAGQTPLGLGIAFAHKYLETGKVTLCYLGDGAINQGVFHESMNMAKLWDIPVIYVIENNQYAMGTSVEKSSAGKVLADRGKGYGMEGIVVNGMDVEEVRKAALETVEKVRGNFKPILMEIKTYRYRGHSMSDPGTYRTREEIEKYKESDPILLYRARLMDEGVLTQEVFEKMEAEVDAEIDEALSFAEESSEPEIEEIYDDIFSPETQIEEIKRFF